MRRSSAIILEMCFPWTAAAATAGDHDLEDHENVVFVVPRQMLSPSAMLADNDERES